MPLRVLAPLLALTAFAMAPPAAIPEIHGRVVERGTGRPVANVEVTARVEGASVTVRTRTAQGQPGHATQTLADGPATPPATALTAADGTYRIQVDAPGTYNVTAQKDSIQARLESALTQRRRQVILDATRTSAVVNFTYARPTDISGYVVDDESNEPLANFVFSLFKVTYRHGVRTLEGGRTARTRGDGSFTVTGLDPGDYLARITPRLGPTLLGDFTPADAEEQDEAHAYAYWPGGYELDTAAAVRAVSGGIANVGTIRVREVSFPRIHVIVSADCDPGQTMNVYFGGASTAGLPCGQDLLLRGLEPGPHTITINTTGTQDARLGGVARFTVSGANQEVPISLSRGHDIDGRLVAAEGASLPPLAQLHVRIQPIESLSLGGNGPFTPDPEGRFRIPNATMTRHNIYLSGLPAGYYVQEARYNGTRVHGPVEFNGNSLAQNLEIVLDNQPATLSGSIEKASGADAVTLVRWPSPDLFTSAKTVTADPDGRFRFATLAPGDYRAVAIPEQDRAALEHPGVLAQLLANADTITLSRGGVQTVTLKLTAVR